MRMSDFVVRESISASVAASTKESVIREMVESLRAAGYFLEGNDPEEIVKAIQKRERLSSTGIGRGVAIPHAKHKSVNQLVGTVAIAHGGGIPFDSVDGHPVFILVMLVSPEERPSEHLRALEGVSRCLRDDAFVAKLKLAESPQTVWDLICQHDGAQG